MHNWYRGKKVDQTFALLLYVLLKPLAQSQQSTNMQKFVQSGRPGEVLLLRRASRMKIEELPFMQEMYA
jgi:hypothetical protein